MQTFETFKVTEQNKFAMASALAMTDLQSVLSQYFLYLANLAWVRRIY